MASFTDAVHSGLSKLASFFHFNLWVFVTVGTLLLLLLILCCCIGCRKSWKYRKASRYEGGSSHKRTPLVPEVHIDMNKMEHQLSVPSDVHSSYSSDIFSLAWIHRFTLEEIKYATNDFSNENNVVKDGQYGSVYRGVLRDGTRVAVKWYLDSNEFLAEVDSLRRTRHKNLVRLLGYCLVGSSRVLVCEYVDNSNLHQWLHKSAMIVSPLTWDMRLDIMIGIAKALIYLHEGLESKIVHRNVKSCNILLDKRWNPKVADFGHSKILDSDMRDVESRVFGTYGYVAPEYACTGILNDMSDVYSFGVLVMEIVSGKSPEDMNLVDWFKKLVETQSFNEIVDPKLSDKPSSKALKSVLLVALKCTDPDAQERPNMGQVLHMLKSIDCSHYHEKHKSTQEAQE